MTTLREELSAEVSAILSREKDKRFWKHSSKASLDEAALKKKYLSQVMSSAKEELEVEYKRCVQDIVDFSSNFAKLFYREMALRYWLLLVWRWSRVRA